MSCRNLYHSTWCSKLKSVHQQTWSDIWDQKLPKVCSSISTNFWTTMEEDFHLPLPKSVWDSETKSPPETLCWESESSRWLKSSISLTHLTKATRNSRMSLISSFHFTAGKFNKKWPNQNGFQSERLLKRKSSITRLWVTSWSEFSFSWRMSDLIPRDTSDSDNIWRMRWLITHATAGMLRLWPHQDGLKSSDVQTDRLMTWLITHWVQEQSLSPQENSRNLAQNCKHQLSLTEKSLESNSRKTLKQSFLICKMLEKNWKLNSRLSSKLIHLLQSMPTELTSNWPRSTFNLSKRSLMSWKKSSLPVLSSHHSVLEESCHACWNTPSELETKREPIWSWSQELPQSRFQSFHFKTIPDLVTSFPNSVIYLSKHRTQDQKVPAHL